MSDSGGVIINRVVDNAFRILMPPTSKNGKICYVEIPTADIARSAEFYHRVFGWTIRTRGNGSTDLDATTGQVSG
jgi:predicted enzyme related to lactoylglutathione lyase